MRPETLRRRIEVLHQRHLDAQPMRPNAVCFAEGDETAEQAIERLGINREDFGTLVIVTRADMSVPREDDA